MRPLLLLLLLFHRPRLVQDMFHLPFIDPPDNPVVVQWRSKQQEDDKPRHEDVACPLSSPLKVLDLLRCSFFCRVYFNVNVDPGLSSGQNPVLWLFCFVWRPVEIAGAAAPVCNFCCPCTTYSISFPSKSFPSWEFDFLRFSSLVFNSWWFLFLRVFL